ncbi:MAG: HipA domain-containing protein, partial [Proteobacteria bacterium]|nr:HipA domain-containing protein [Pseudomonadota bacterium]
LIPQGEPLKRLMRRYGIAQDHQYEEILTQAPLASPGNIRVKEPWVEIERVRPNYQSQGFTRDDIIKYQSDFIEYMERIGAPIGGTSGAGGGSPKFLLREDHQGRFHADGMLDDSKTKYAWLIKFPYTDSNNSKAISQVEKRYYDFIRTLPLVTGDEIQISDDVLFIKRFDRERDIDGRLLYHGLESLYSAHNIATHGSLLWHEDNLRLLAQVSTNPPGDILEYLKRDLLNQMLANPIVGYPN